MALAIALLLPAAPPARAADPFLRRTPTVIAVQKVGPAVVNITTERIVQRRPFRPMHDPLFDQFFRDFFQPGVPRKSQSLGSGVVIDAERHVLTNDHVIARADAIHVALADGRSFEARLVGADPNNDLAVLQLETQEKVPWVAPGTSSDLMVGEPVIAIGNPFGLSNTVTTGVLSAVDRSLRTNGRVFRGFLQTDASINPGNSGGPLLNADGQLVGINSAIYSGAEGIGFAIPIDVAKRVVRELIAHGEVTPVWLGLDVQDLDANLADVMHVPSNVHGALIARVRPKTPAAGAGIRRGEVVTAVDGEPIRSAQDYYDVLAHSTEGQELHLVLHADGRDRQVPVRARAIPQAAVGDLAEQILGLRLRVQPRGGAVVASVRPGSGAAHIGLKPGDLVLGIDGRALDGKAALRRSVLDLRGRTQALLVVQRGRGRYHVSIPLS